MSEYIIIRVKMRKEKIPPVIVGNVVLPCMLKPGIRCGKISTASSVFWRRQGRALHSVFFFVRYFIEEHSFLFVYKVKEIKKSITIV